MTENESVKSRGGAAPFGYRWRDGHLEIDEKEAPVRRLIFDLFLKHRRKRTVAKMLNDLGYKTRSGADFSDMAVDRLIRDTTAKGFRNEVGIQVNVDPIVGVDIWERANLLLSVREGKQPANTFAGRTRCSCGGAMKIPSKSNKYVCSTCRFKIPQEDLEHIFVSQIGPLTFGGHALIDRWASLSDINKRLIVEHLCEEIVVARESISIRFACDPYSFKTPTLEQRSEPTNESPSQFARETSSSTDFADPLLSEAQAARFLGISKMTLLRKRNAGLLRFFRVGVRVLYSKEKHLKPYLEGCESKGQTKIKAE